MQQKGMIWVRRCSVSSARFSVFALFHKNSAFYRFLRLSLFCIKEFFTPILATNIPRNEKRFNIFMYTFLHHSDSIVLKSSLLLCNELLLNLLGV